MKIFDLAVTKRNKVGKEYAKKLRRQSKIPAVLYQRGEETLSLELEKRTFFNLIHKRVNENLLFNLQIDTGLSRTALISELQLNPINDEILHVDFRGISMSEKVVVRVPLRERGEAPGVADGGLLDHSHREIEIECFPNQIPERIDVDVSTLRIGQSIHLSDITLPEGVKCLEESDLVLFSVLAPRAEEVPQAAEAATTTAEPEVIKKGKETKEGEEAEEAK